MVLRWSHQAVEQLASIDAFISEDSPVRAAKFVAHLVKNTERALLDHPHIGRIVAEICNPNIRELIFKGYRVIYKVDWTDITIITVFEGHRMLRVDDLVP